MNVAIAGLPLSGKTCLFDALSEGAVDSAADPARPDRPNAAAVAVPDERLDWLHAHYETPKKVPVHLQWLDLPGLAPGRSDLESQNTQVLEHLHRADALVYVLRAFESETVPGRVDPEADAATLAGEFLLADLAVVERRIEKVEAQMAKPVPNRDALAAERDFLDRCRQALEAQQPLQGVPETETERNILRNFAALTLKPTVTVLNVDEGDAGRPDAVAAAHPDLPPPVFGVCASLEAEIRGLPPQEQAA
ncbi:MAG: GTPase, partial [Phycisphaerae bacterium]